VTITVPSGAVVVVDATFDLNLSGGGFGIGSLLLDGVEQRGQALQNVLGRITQSQHWRLTPAAGSHTFQLAARVLSPGNLYVSSQHTRIVVQLEQSPLAPSVQLPDRLGSYGVVHSDWNTCTQNGWYMAAGAANAPDASGNWFLGWAVVHNEVPGWCQQEAWQFSAKPNIRFRRDRSNGTWSAWYSIGPSVVRVWANNTQVVGSGAWVTLGFNLANYDDDGCWDGNTALYCRKPGVYKITGGWYMNGVGGGYHRLGRIILNGSNEIAQNRYITNGYPSGVDTGGMVTAEWKMLLNEYVQIQVYQDSGSNQNVMTIANGPWFAMHKVS